MIKKRFKFLLTGVILACFVLPHVNAQKYMQITQKDGKVISIELSDIQKLTFTKLALALPEQQKKVIQATLNFKTYPNPASDLVNIEYSLESQGDVSLEVYNLQGILVHSYTPGMKGMGTYNYQWNTGKVPSGTYICQIRQNNKLTTKKITINK
jgi:hypothetical protein